MCGPGDGCRPADYRPVTASRAGGTITPGVVDGPAQGEFATKLYDGGCDIRIQIKPGAPGPAVSAAADDLVARSIVDEGVGVN
jgi:hypothetical protein